MADERMAFVYSEEEALSNEIARENARLLDKFRYLTIPMTIFRELGLSGNEAIVFALIDSWYSDDGQRFYFTNEQLGRLYNLSTVSVSQILKRLQEKKLIKLGYKRKSNGGQIRFVDLMTLRNLKLQLKESLSSNIKKVNGNIYNLNTDNLNTLKGELNNSSNLNQNTGDNQNQPSTSTPNRTELPTEGSDPSPVPPTPSQRLPKSATLSELEYGLLADEYKGMFQTYFHCKPKVEFGDSFPKVCKAYTNQMNKMMIDKAKRSLTTEEILGIVADEMQWISSQDWGKNVTKFNVLPNWLDKFIAQKYGKQN